MITKTSNTRQDGNWPGAITGLSWLILSSLCGGCASVVSIEAEDTVGFGDIEASMPLGDDKRLRFRATRASGDFKQSLDAGERIQIGNSRIDGTAEVDGELDLAYYSLAFGWDRFGDGLTPGTLRQSFYLGVAGTGYDLELTHAGERFRLDDYNAEFYLQYGLSHAFTESLEAGLSWAVSVGPEYSGISEIDIGLDYTLYRQWRISGGYRWLEYSYSRLDGDSDIEIDFHGPYLGITFAY